MPGQLTFSIPPDAERPNFFLITLSDNNDNYYYSHNSKYHCIWDNITNWSYSNNSCTYELSPGQYHYTISAGPEWTFVFGSVEITREEHLTVSFSMQRIVDRTKIGLCSGDNHVHSWRGRQKDDFETIFAAGAIDFVGIQYWGLYSDRESIETPPAKSPFKIGNTWVSTDEEIEMDSPWCDFEDSSIIGLPDKISDIRSGIGYRMNCHFYQLAREKGCKMIIYQSPLWSQFPIDVALGLVDSVNICDNFFSLRQPAKAPWEYTCFRPEDCKQKEQFGIALRIFEKYYRILNAGFKLAVSGGSAYPTGGGGGPVGMNRFYVYDDNQNNPETFYDAWKEGRTFATNGPLLLARIDGNPPSSNTITLKTRETRLSVQIYSNKPIKRIQWVGDGTVIAEKRIEKKVCPQNLRWEVKLDMGGYHWVAARCFGESERIFFSTGGKVSPPFLSAHTSPFYMESFGADCEIRQRAISEIVQQFDWMQSVVEGRTSSPFATRFRKTPPLNKRERNEIMETINKARSVF
jgi:hypothetical protein